jgi:hypothetical protein
MQEEEIGSGANKYGVPGIPEFPRAFHSERSNGMAITDITPVDLLRSMLEGKIPEPILKEIVEGD